MTTLAIWFSVLLVIALALLLWPLLKPSALETVNAETTNSPTSNTPSKKPINQKVVLGIGVFVPAFTMVMYFSLGTPQFADISKSQIQPEVVTLVDKLEQRLQQDPKDLTGWLLLGRSYMVEENTPKAIQAYEKALKLDPQNLRALLPLADALAIQDNGRLNDRAYQLLQTAYKVDPKNTMTLWLLGMAEKQRGQTQQATDYWLSLYDLLPEDHTDRTTVLGLLTSVGYIPGMHGVGAPPTAETQAPNGAETTTSLHAISKSENKNEITFELEVSSNLLQKYPNAIIFLYAKQRSGMPMPIAAKQFPISELSVGKNTFTLNKENFIQQNRQLKDFKSFTAGYRLMSKNTVDSQILQKNEQEIEQGQLATFMLRP